MNKYIKSFNFYYDESEISFFADDKSYTLIRIHCEYIRSESKLLKITSNMDWF